MITACAPQHPILGAAWRNLADCARGHTRRRQALQLPLPDPRHGRRWLDDLRALRSRAGVNPTLTGTQEESDPAKRIREAFSLASARVYHI
jgi:hypothetical protein